MLLGKPCETTRRFIKKLSSERVKEAYAKWVLKRLAGESDFVLIAIDPTYAKGLKEGFLVASLIVGKRGRSIPLWWERFNWRELEEKGIYRVIRYPKHSWPPEEVFLVFASLGFLRDSAEKTLELPKGFLGLLRRGYYSLTYLGRLCLMMADKLKSARGLRINLEFTDT